MAKTTRLISHLLRRLEVHVVLVRARGFIDFGFASCGHDAKLVQLLCRIPITLLGYMRVKQRGVKETDGPRPT